jgi:hypothetical protein
LGINKYILEAIRQVEFISPITGDVEVGEITNIEIVNGLKIFHMKDMWTGEVCKITQDKFI